MYNIFEYPGSHWILLCDLRAHFYLSYSCAEILEFKNSNKERMQFMSRGQDFKLKMTRA